MTANDHPQLALLVETLPAGRYADGALIVTAPDAHADELHRWLLGKPEGRVSIGRTAFGDLLVFRDLRERARALELDGAEEACDIALLDIHYSEMNVVANDAAELVTGLEDPKWQDAFLRRELFLSARSRLGALGDGEAYAFAPALRLGGSESPESIVRVEWKVHQDLLLQLALGG